MKLQFITFKHREQFKMKQFITSNNILQLELELIHYLIACKSLIMLYYHQLLDLVFLVTCFPSNSFGFVFLNRADYWFKLTQLNIWVKKKKDNFGNVHSKPEVHKLRSMRPMISQFQKEIQNLS